jgi:RNA polymerase sigma factor (sigma-70 family)
VKLSVLYLFVCIECVGRNGHWPNERVIKHYEGLTVKIKRQFIRTYRIPEQEASDLHNELVMKLVKMPAGYRPNSSAAYTVIKNGAVDWVRKYRKWAETEDSGEEENSAVFRIADGTDWQERFGRKRLAEQTVQLLQSLPDPERICLTFHFGIGTARPLSLYLIARKLGVTTDYVKRKICRGQFLLNRSLLSRGTKSSNRIVTAAILA